MRPIHLFLTAAAATLAAGAVLAQDAPPSGDAGQGAPPADASQGAPPSDASQSPASGDASSMPANGQAGSGGAPLGSPDHPIPQNSPTPSDQAYKLKAGDPNVVSNAPVPDTPQNRAALGQPLSHGGKATPASGD
jgi:hypothetical protein